MLSASLPEPVHAYAVNLARRAQAWGVELTWGQGHTLPYGSPAGPQVSGFFVEDPRPTLAVAVGKPVESWLPILVHEGCHMDQWHEQSPVWSANTMPDGREAVDWLDAWCDRQMVLSPDALKDVIDRAMAVELDCERRVLEKITRFGLPIDPVEYAQRANAYVHFYRHVGLTGRWYPPGQAPYERQDVWSWAPKVLVEEAPKRLMEAFNRAYA